VFVAKKNNSENFPISVEQVSVVPRGGLLVQALTTDLTKANGRELGLLAQSARAKSAASLLEFCVCVQVAYDRYYLPWKKVGRKGSKRVKEAREAEDHWNNFLDEIGWGDFDRYSKQIRQYAEIGRRAQVLRPHSEALPSAVSALTTLVKAAKTDAQLRKLAAKCSPESTAKDVKELVKARTAVTTPDDVEALEQQEDIAPTLKLTLNLSAEMCEANAAVLALMIALEFKKDAIGNGVTLEAARKFKFNLQGLIRAYLDSEELKRLVSLSSDRALNSEVVIAAKEAKRIAGEQMVRDIRDSAVISRRQEKKRDFSGLKV
jgi:hypothetical protein